MLDSLKQHNSDHFRYYWTEKLLKNMNEQIISDTSSNNVAIVSPDDDDVDNNTLSNVSPIAEGRKIFFEQYVDTTTTLAFSHTNNQHDSGENRTTNDGSAISDSASTSSGSSSHVIEFNCVCETVSGETKKK